MSTIDLNYLGQFDSIEDVWAAHPEGGHEGDYLDIVDTRYRWNKYELIWENANTVTQSPAREVDNIDGDLHVQNNLHVGGKLYASVKQPNCGLFSSLSALQAAYPHPEVGMWATIGDGIPGDIYRCDTAGEWTATGETGGADVLDIPELKGEIKSEVNTSIGYFLCDTATAEAAKTIAATGYSLRAGGNIRIKMTNANTADAVTLNINNTGAKVLYYNGAQANASNTWEAGEVVEVYYDGTQYNAFEDTVKLEKKIFGGEKTLSPIEVRRGWVNNGSTSGVNIGYIEYNKSYDVPIYDLTEYKGKSIDIKCTRSTWAYRYVVCKDYTTLPTTREEYDNNPNLWTDNKVLANSGRGSSGGEHFYTIEIPDVEEHYYLLLCASHSDATSYYAKYEEASKIPTKVSQLENDSDFVTAEEAGIDEKEWVTEEKNRLSSLIRAKLDKDIVIIGFNTDQHIRQTSLDTYTKPVLRGLKALKDMATNIPFSMICLGGDAAGYSTEDTQEEVDKDVLDVIKATDTDKCPVIYIAGNHDAGQNITPAWTTTDGRSLFNTALKSNIVRRKVDGYGTRSTNCYFDDNANKIRFVMLDAWSRALGRKEGQGKTYTEMAEILNEALSDNKLLNSDWSVIIFSHNVFRNVTGNNYDPMPSTYWDDVVVPKINAGLNVIACFNGHSHYDGQGVRDNHLFICSQQASVQSSEESFDGITYSRTNNSGKETSFDIFVVDKDDKKIYAYKYGAGMDRIFYYGTDNPRIMLCSLSGTVTNEGTPMTGTITAKHHNTTYTSTLDANGSYSFPYLCPECDWELSIGDYVETYAAVEGEIEHNIDVSA